MADQMENGAVTDEIKDDLTPEAGIEELRRKLADEQSARQAESAARMAAERAAKDAQAAARAATAEVEDANLTMVKTALAAVDRDLQVHEENFRVASEAGDWAAAGKAMTAQAAAQARKLQLENGKEELEARAKAPNPQPVTQTDPVEMLASQLSPTSAAWVRSHPQFARDPVQYKRMIAAHSLAEADGLKPDTDEYFASIESTLRIRKPEPAQTETDTPLSNAAAPRKPPPSAPPSRGGGNTIRLSAEEVEAAEMAGLTPEQYAANKAFLKQQGRLH
jgi:hypothetical protein